MRIFPKQLLIFTLTAFVLLGFGAAGAVFWHHTTILERHNEQFSHHYHQQMIAMTRDIVQKEVQLIQSVPQEQLAQADYQEQVFQRLRQLRFGHNQNGYFFLLELLDPKGGDGFAKERVLPIDPDQEGQLISTRTPDIKGHHYREAYLRDLLVHQEATVSYHYLKPDTGEPARKLSYLTYLPDPGWIIGAGFYLEDLEPILQEEAQKSRGFILRHSLLIALAILAATAVVIALYIRTWRRLQGRFLQYEQQIQAQSNQLLQKERALNENAKIVATGEMLKMVAHHWRQPLNAVSILIQDLGDAHRAGELDGAYLKRSIQKAMQVIGQMSSTIDSFRHFLSDTKEGVIDLRELTEDAIALLRPELDEAAITLTLTAPDGPLRVRGSSALLGRSLIGLLINAKESIAPEGRQGRITVRLFRRMGAAVVEIEDSGPGVPPELIEQIFLPYFSTKEAAKSSGIGLYLTRHTVESRMKGRLRFFNTPGRVRVRMVLAVL